MSEADLRARRLDSAVAELQTAHVETRRRLEALQEQAAGASAAGSTAGTSDAAPSEANPKNVMVGNLGWDTPSATLAERARQLLAGAGVAPEHVVDCAPAVGRQGTGSNCDILFSTVDSATAFTLHVRATTTEYVDGRRVWAAVALSRMVHRAAEALEDVEAQRGDSALSVTRRMMSNAVLVGGRRAAVAARGRILLTPWAQSRYSAEERVLVEGAAAS